MFIYLKVFDTAAVITGEGRLCFTMYANTCENGIKKEILMLESIWKMYEDGKQNVNIKPLALKKWNI